MSINYGFYNNRAGHWAYRNYGLVNRGQSFWGYPYRVVAGGIVDKNGTIFTGKPGITNTDPNNVRDPLFVPQRGDVSCGCSN
jgi:hypothetical protein